MGEPAGDDTVFLTSDPGVELGKETISLVKGQLGIELRSTRFADIVAEILLLGLMPGRGLRPTLDGTYEIHLCGLLWEATEIEAYEFVGGLREQELLGSPPRAASHQSRDLRPALRQSMESLAAAVDTGRPGWLANELEAVDAGRSHHPLAEVPSRHQTP
jgi:hypothetical protein